jgi:dephospho-CoA kinase
MVISGDQLGHEALRQPDIRAAIVRRWGAGVLAPDGTVQRRRLAEIVFANPPERRALESLVFPWIERRIREEIDAAQKQRTVSLIVLDAAILLEAGWNKACDRILYVHAPRTVRMRRLQKQRGWSAKEVQERESAQMSLTEKVSRADYAIDNSGPPEHVAQPVDDLLKHWDIVYQQARGV